MKYAYGLVGCLTVGIWLLVFVILASEMGR